MKMATRYNRTTGEQEQIDVPVGRWLLRSVLALALVLAVSVAGCAGCKQFNRAQRLADARNRTSITRQEIKTQQQQNGVVTARAQQRFLEAVGIRRAQDEISKTLTPLYIQHEAIQAQERTAASGRNNTIIYVPSGNNGVPLVQTPPLRPPASLEGK